MRTWFMRCVSQDDGSWSYMSCGRGQGVGVLVTNDGVDVLDHGAQALVCEHFRERGTHTSSNGEYKDEEPRW